MENCAGRRMKPMGIRCSASSARKYPKRIWKHSGSKAFLGLRPGKDDMIIYIEINIGKSGKKTILNKADNRFVNIKS